MRKICVKICGLKSMDDVSYINAARVDFAGFVFAPGKRQVDEEFAAKMARYMRGDIGRVGVFVDENPDTVVRLLKSGLIHAAQLHGNETEDEIRFIQNKTGENVIRAVQVRKESDLVRCKNTHADLLLLDSGKGSGKTFDWSLIKEIQRPFLLAGGLTPENVEQAVKQVHPFGLDVSSGVETEGRKNWKKIQAFMHAVR